MLAPAITNALTIDVEDYFQVSAFAPYIRRDEWDTRECRVERNVARVLELLAVRDVQATFFMLGWVAERYPQLVHAIVSGGHELASHGYGHERVSDLDRSAFTNDVTRSKMLLEDLAGRPVLGYRAPSFSIGSANLWAFEVLARAGYRYSSSVYPIQHLSLIHICPCCRSSWWPSARRPTSSFPSNDDEIRPPPARDVRCV